MHDHCMYNQDGAAMASLQQHCDWSQTYFLSECLLQSTRPPSFALQVVLLKQLSTQNIVRFLGLCITDTGTMRLVTEFMECSDLYNAMSCPKTSEYVSWYKR